MSLDAIAAIVDLTLSLVATVLAGIAAVFSYRNHGQSTKISLQVNGRIDQLIEAEKKLAEHEAALDRERA